MQWNRLKLGEGAYLNWIRVASSILSTIGSKAGSDTDKMLFMYSTNISTTAQSQISGFQCAKRLTKTCRPLAALCPQLFAMHLLSAAMGEINMCAGGYGANDERNESRNARICSCIAVLVQVEFQLETMWGSFE